MLCSNIASIFTLLKHPNFKAASLNGKRSKAAICLKGFLVNNVTNHLLIVCCHLDSISKMIPKLHRTWLSFHNPVVVLQILRVVIYIRFMSAAFCYSKIFLFFSNSWLSEQGCVPRAKCLRHCEIHYVDAWFLKMHLNFRAKIAGSPLYISTHTQSSYKMILVRNIMLTIQIISLFLAIIIRSKWQLYNFTSLNLNKT